MKKGLLSLIICIFFGLKVQSQSSELGLMLGISSYKGDLNQSLFNTSFFHPAAGVFYRHCLNSRWAFRAGFNYGRISADDASSNDAFQKFRNLSFRSDILELNGLFEFNFFQFQTSSELSSQATPFVFSGLAVFKFNPKAELGGEWVALQPLGTEGQGTSEFSTRTKYSRVQVCLVLGGGFKFKLNKRFSLSIEAGARRTYTDYLDDISTTYASKPILAATYGPDAVILSDRSPLSATDYNNKRQRGNASDQDWYMFAGATLSWTLSGKYGNRCKPFDSKLK